MNERILVVDDEESLRLSLKFKLKSAGFEVDTAIDGEDALEKLKGKAVDVVLLDINMPRMSGIEALTFIRQTYPQTEAIMLTGFADFSTAIECLKIGAKDYLVKPVDTTELVTRLRSLVRSRSTERALHEVHQEYLGFLSEELSGPLKKVQTLLDQAIKLGSDGEKERKKILASVREITERMETKLKLLTDFSERAATPVAPGDEDNAPEQLTEHLKGIRKGSGR
jgi:DNA-binding response OmpR family regulator